MQLNCIIPTGCGRRPPRRPDRDAADDRRAVPTGCDPRAPVAGAPTDLDAVELHREVHILPGAPGSGPEGRPAYTPYP
jgi:hypothetical protein